MAGKTKWTPGPWTVDKRDDGWTIGRDSRLIVVVGCDEIDEAGEGEVMSPEQKANARLIAAAPELAAELTRIEKALSEHAASVVGPVPQRIRFALKHAREALTLLSPGRR